MTSDRETLPLDMTRVLRPYDLEVQQLFAAVRSAILHEAPHATELVYDSYNAVAVAYSFTGRLRDAFCHAAAYARHVNLGFNRGADLPDPHRILKGSGKSIRHVRVTEPSTVRQDSVVSLIRSAVERAPSDGERSEATVIVKAVSRKRRRRATT
jgi:hypothetical protein